MAELFALGASELLRGYRQRDFSPVEVMQSVLARIAHWEPRLCATYLLRPEQALAQARASEARWQRGQPCGVLDGVPMTLKDNVATAGDPSPLGGYRSCGTETRASSMLPKYFESTWSWR